MVTPPFAGFILHGYREEVNRMLTVIRRALDRFWNGPLTGSEDGSAKPRYELTDPRPEDQILAEQDYWRREYDEDDERCREDEYTL